MKGKQIKKVLLSVICAIFMFGMLGTSPIYAERGDRERGDRNHHGGHDEYRRGIRTRIVEAKKSIERGIERGKLTRREARKLIDEFDYILDKIDYMKDDGYLSQKERNKINRDLDRLEFNIRKEKRDDDRNFRPNKRSDDNHHRTW
ncbi:MAG: hypothetical protein HQK77_11070 [Desulfobacterales bacterium]|nr:hypothetical protein [Desulfobacterales bacterium]